MAYVVKAMCYVDSEGYVKEVYDNSAMVIIRTTHPDDDGLVVGYHGKTIVPFTEMRAVEC